METKCNCNECLKMDVCKFVESMNKFEKEMYGMFEYDEQNKFAQILKTSHKECKFYQALIPTNKTN